MTICPCCGFKFEGDLSKGCDACGARPVGEPLPRPEVELPSYGRSLLLTVSGTVLVLLFLVQTIVALLKNDVLSLDFKTLLAAGETAAWRLKWVAIPITIVVLWGGRWLYRSVVESPSRFCGLRYARTGFFASLLFPAMVAVFIGITVPERLGRRQDGIEAAGMSQGRDFARWLFQYRERYGTLPSDLKDLSRLPDADGSIAAALKSLDASGYKPTGDLAAIPKKKPHALAGAVIRDAAINTAADDTLPEVLSFTNYELRLPGTDKILGTEDDVVVLDGLVGKASEFPNQGATSTAANKKQSP